MAAQRALWEALGAAGVTEPSEAGSEDDDGRSRQWLAAPWLPPAKDEPDELERQRRAFEQAGIDHGIDAIWCVKVETGIDGVAWLELAASEARTPAESAEQVADRGRGRRCDLRARGRGAVQRAGRAAGEPAASGTGEAASDDDDDDDDDGDDDDEGPGDGVALESRWRNGPPPLEHAVSVPDRALPRDHRRLRLGELRDRAQAVRRGAARRGVGGQRVLRAVAVGVSGRARRRVRAVPARRRRPRSRPPLGADVGRAVRRAGDRVGPGPLPAVDRRPDQRRPAGDLGAVRRRRRRGEVARDRPGRRRPGRRRPGRPRGRGGRRAGWRSEGRGAVHPRRQPARRPLSAPRRGARRWRGR